MLKALLPPMITGAVLAAIGAAVHVTNGWTLATLFVGGYAAHVTLAEMWTPLMQRLRRGDSFGSALVNGQLRRGRRRFGSYIVHAGVVIALVAIAVSSTMRTSHEVRLSKGQSTTLGAYTLTFLGTEVRQEPNREATIARFAVAKDGKPLTTLEPRMNQYPQMREPIGTPAVYSTMSGDLYLSIMNLETDNAGILVLRMPMVGWIWFAVIMMGVGGLIALIPSRTAVAVEVKEPVSDKTATAPALS
jgi:cytochrome c-type biogenesis protein CcmF